MRQQKPQPKRFPLKTTKHGKYSYYDVTIPREMVEWAQWDDGDLIEISVKGKRVVVDNVSSVNRTR